MKKIWIQDQGSGMEKIWIQDLGSGMEKIRIRDLRSGLTHQVPTGLFYPGIFKKFLNIVNMAGLR